MILSIKASVLVADGFLFQLMTHAFVNESVLEGDELNLYEDDLATFVSTSERSVVFLRNTSTLNVILLPTGFEYMIGFCPLTDKIAKSLITFNPNRLSGNAVEFHVNGSLPAPLWVIGLAVGIEANVGVVKP